MAAEITQIASYRILKKINQGSSGVVYLGEKDGQQYAVKLWKTVDAESLSRFRKETSTLARLQHENLVKIFDAGEYNGLPYLVMDFIEGRALKEKIEAEGIQSEQESLKILKSICGALQTIHRNNLVHRDLKPANVIITSSGQVKLIDLGLVADVDEIQNVDSLVGTPLYCAPEQTKVLKRPVDFRSDLYSLGVILFECITGQVPFSGSLNEILEKHASAPVPDPRNLNPSASGSLSVLVGKLLSKDPDDRYQSAAGLMFDLDRLDEIQRLLSANKDPLLGSRDHATRTAKAAFIPREQETAKLNKAWDKCLSAGSGIIILQGKSGSGKTRLINEFIGNMRPEELLVLRGKCQLFDKQLPFGLVREAIENFLEEVEKMPGEQRDLALERVKKASEGWEQYVGALVKGLQRPLGVDVHTAPTVDVEKEGEQFLTGISSFLANLSRHWRRVVLFIDDIQWLDDSSIRLIQRVFKDATALKFGILSTSRDDEESLKHREKLEPLLNGYPNEVITLGLLDKKQTELLITEYLGSKTIERTIVDMILTKSAGNPLVALEFLRACVEQGALRLESSSWVIDEKILSGLNLSSDIFQLIMGRIEGASSSTRKFLDFAAVYGTSFNLSEVAHSAQIDMSGINQVATWCTQQGLIERAGGGKYKFIHDKIIESLREAVGEEGRRRISDDLAATLAMKQERSDDERFALARLSLSGSLNEERFDSSVEAVIDAGTLALNNFAYEEAYYFFDSAQRLLQRHQKGGKREISLARKLAVCSSMSGRMEVARQYAKVYLDSTTTKDERIDALSLTVWVLRNHDTDPVEGWEYFKLFCSLIGTPHPVYFHWKLLHLFLALSAFAFLEILGAPTMLFRWLAKKDTAYYKRLLNVQIDGAFFAETIGGKTSDVILLGLRIALLARWSGDKDNVAIAYAYLGSVLSRLSLKSAAVYYLELASNLAKETNDPFTVARVEWYRMFGLFVCNAIKDYYQEYKSKSEFFAKYLRPSELGQLMSANVYFLGFKGRESEAIEVLETSLFKDPSSFRFGIQFAISGYGAYWLSLALQGRHNVSAPAKAFFLKENNRFRFHSAACRYFSYYSVQSARYLEDLSPETEEYTNYILRRGSTIHPNGINSKSFVGFYRLYEYERAKTVDAKFSARRKLKTILRSLFFTLHIPLFRCNYYFILGAYHRINGNYRLAQMWLDKAEKLADESGSLRVVFDILRERARISKALGQGESMRNSLMAAWAMAFRQHWKPTIGLLSEEFGSELDGLVSNLGAGFDNTATRATIGQTVQSGGSTVLSGGRGRSKDSFTVMGGQSLSGGIQNSRFVDALLSVSSAFIESTDPIEQGKAILKQVVKVFGAERGFIFINSETSGRPEIVAGKESNGNDLTKLTGFSNTVVTKVCESGTPMILSGTEKGEAEVSESVVLHNLRSIMATPLKNKGNVFGVVYVDSTLAKGMFNNSDLEIFSTMANSISIALELSRAAKAELEKERLKSELAVQAAIATESKKVKILVDNMEQALFSVEESGKIVEPVSRFSERIFGEQVSGRNLVEVLYKDVERSRQDAVRSVLVSVFGEDELQWSLAEDGLPRKIPFRALNASTHQQEERVLKVQATPIWDDRKSIEKLLFVVEDITTLENLEKEIMKNRREARVLGEILVADAEALKGFLSAGLEMVGTFKASPPASASPDLAVMLRELHTLKGNARLHKAALLAEQLHNSESAIIGVRDSEAGSQTSLQETIVSEMGKAAQVIQEYHAILKKVRAGTGQTTGPALNSKALERLEAALKAVEDRFGQEGLSELRSSVRRLYLKSVKELAERFDDMVHDIASQLNKKVKIRVEGDAFLSERQVSALQECFLHLFRNSIDHGFEESTERTKISKPEVGTITVECRDKDGSVTIAIRDDGRGMNGDAILRRAIERKIVKEGESDNWTDEQKLNLIFAAGFSTKDVATDISGRGIGMDVVRSNISKLGGDLKVSSKYGVGSTFTIVLPEDSENVAKDGGRVKVLARGTG